MKKKRRVCSKCGSTRILPVVFGRPTAELQKEYEKGKVMLGGCEVGEEMPEFYCKKCDDYCDLVEEIGGK
jgi:hypothetical protein